MIPHNYFVYEQVKISSKVIIDIESHNHLDLTIILYFLASLDEFFLILLPHIIVTNNVSALNFGNYFVCVYCCFCLLALSALVLLSFPLFIVM